MKTYGEYERTATDGAPFSSETDRLTWSFSVCSGGGVSSNRCVLDAAVDAGDGCPLIRLSLDRKTPVEWAGTNGTVIYRCTEKTNRAEAHAAAAAEAKARIAAQFYPLFEVP